MLRRALVLVVMILAAVPMAEPSTVFAAPTCFGQPATYVMPSGGGVFYGTPGNDVVVGSSAYDFIDFFIGGAHVQPGGVDLACGGGGNDYIYVAGLGSKADGGSGNDKLLGVGSAIMFGGAGDDVVQARCCTANPSDPPTLGDGGSGNDTLTADFTGHIIGGSGNDSLMCDNSADNAFCVALEGGSGDDTLRNLDGGATPLLDCGSGRRDKVFANGALTVRNCEASTT